METVLNAVSLYGLEGITFVKTDNPCTLTMQIRLYTDSSDNLNVDKLNEKQERDRTMSCRSSSSQTDSQPKS